MTHLQILYIPESEFTEFSSTHLPFGWNFHMRAGIEFLNVVSYMISKD